MTGRRCLAGGRRLVGALSSFIRITDRTFVFSLATTSILASKCLHIYIHSQVLSLAELIQWLPSLFMQDTVIILLLRFLLDGKALGRFGGGWFRFLATTFSTIIALLQLFLAVSNISFFLMIGGEPRWRNAGLVADSNTWAIMLTGLWAFVSANVGLVFGSMLLKSPLFFFAGLALDVVKGASSMILSKIGICRRSRNEVEYVPVGKEEYHDDVESSYPDPVGAPAAAPRRDPKLRMLYMGTAAFLFLQLLTSILQPAEQAFIFLSWTAIAMPIVDYLRGSDSPLTNIIPVYEKSMDQKWNVPFTLGQPTHWDWLPAEGSAPAGFDDWYGDDKQHYDRRLDPLSHPNYDKDLLDSLKGKLSDVSIRNVMFIFLESTRKDVFPFKKGEYIYNKMAATWNDKKLPEEAEKRAATLTQNARWLTGDYSDGFDHQETPRRGGINVNKNTPSATYTLKSLTGGLCGINPLVADMNKEWNYHIYQPCLPQIFKVLNGLNDASATDSFTNRPFNNSFMMSVTGQYDHQYELMKGLGYLEDEMVDSEYLHSDKAAFGNITVEDVRYDGMPEPAIEDYFRDAFRTSRENDTRLFLTHLTSSTHFPYGLPGDEVYVPMVQDDANNHLQDISKHLNAVGYVDRWVGHLLDIVEEEGATNDTLVVLVGDHGVPVIEMGGASPWGVPSMGSFHVPLVLSHPHLPVIDINDLVSSMSILPTVVDLLLETGGLGAAQQKAARDLLATYEAPSLLRPLQVAAEDRRWYFTSVSPGGQTISTRSMDSPRWRLLVPLIQDAEWYFSDLETDPHEETQVASFDFVGMLRAVEKKHGVDAAKWAEEAAFATRWWVADNHQRWRYI